MQKTDKFIINGMAVQSEVRDTYLLTAEMFARQISGLSGHGMHSAYSCTPAGATYEFLLGRQIFWPKKWPTCIEWRVPPNDKHLVEGIDLQNMVEKKTMEVNVGYH